jgi:hypothetical protein
MDSVESSQLLSHHERMASPRQMKDRCSADKAIAASAKPLKVGALSFIQLTYLTP